jgi:hypothetical protein
MSVHPDPKKYRPGVPKVYPDVTNAMFSKLPDFVKACEDKGVKPSKRQASKCRNKMNRWSK